MHAPCEVGEKTEMASNSYLSLLVEDLKKVLIRENPGHEVTFKVE